MMFLVKHICRTAILLTGMLLADRAAAQNVPTYHGDAARSGLYVTPKLTWSEASKVRRDTAFSGIISGNVYAQPLYWLPSGSDTGRILVATESDIVYALDATTGKVVWQRTLGTPVPQSTLPCGNIAPVGVTGTPVIDAAAGKLFVAAMVDDSGGVHQRVFGLALATGKILPGWPIDVATALSGLGKSFDPNYQGQRSALTLVDNRLYVTYAGNWGDCGDYHGWAVGFDLGTPKLFGGWSTRAQGGGIWAQGGIAYDGTSMFLATGNTMGATQWGDGEAIVRLSPGLAHANAAANVFAPINWQSLDHSDLDLGGTGPLPVDVPSGTSTVPRLVGLGKSGDVYLLNRSDLGGIGHSLATVHVSSDQIITGPATYRQGDAAMVAFEGTGTNCPSNQAGGNLTVLRLTAAAKSPISTAWCASVSGRGSPIVTTTDGTTDPIVWILGAEGDNQLHGFRGTDGATLFGGGGSAGTMSNLRHFATLLSAAGRFYVASDGQIYAFNY